MTHIDLLLEQHFKEVGERPQRKFEETITSFNRDIFYYNRDTSKRNSTKSKTTYEDHRRVIETAINVMGKNTQHEIALCILTHRFFETYRNTVFSSKKDFTADYSFLIRRIGAMFNPTTGQVKTSTIPRALQAFTEPTLVQVNYLSGDVKEVTIPDTGETLNEWAIKFNENAPESTKYMVAGMSVGI